MVCEVSGHDAEAAFAHESGGHRWQGESGKRGSIHTSTVTVAVLPVPTEVQLHVDERDLEWRTIRGSGAGGQNRNKLETAVQLTHRPSGLSVRCETERSQLQNKQSALRLLRSRLLDAAQASAAGTRASQRKELLGGGSRGDKRRTIALQRDDVTDHRLGRRMRTKEYLVGDLNIFYGFALS